MEQIHSFHLPYNSNNNNENVMSSIPKVDVEYRLVVKKKQTAACENCKKRKKRCSGDNPCLYCSDRGLECVYTTQQKRGKRKQPEDPTIATSTLTKSHKLWIENERCEIAEAFCGIRYWWRNLLNTSGITKASTNIFRAQNFILNAWMARLSKDFAKADFMHNEALSLLNVGGFEASDLVPLATLHLLLGDYTPANYGHYQRSWEIAKTTTPRNAQERHVYFYSMSYYAHTLTNTERHATLLSVGSDALQSSEVDIWDTTNFMVIKIASSLERAFKDFGSLNFFRRMQHLTIDKELHDSLLMDARTVEIIFQSHPHLFGFEFTFCLHLFKVALLWAGGDRDRAKVEAVRLMELLTKLGDKVIFLLGEARGLLVPLVILNLLGIRDYNFYGLQAIETIFAAEPAMVDDLAPLFAELRVTDPQPSPESAVFTPSSSASSINLSLNTSSPTTPSPDPSPIYTPSLSPVEGSPFSPPAPADIFCFTDTPVEIPTYITELPTSTPVSFVHPEPTIPSTIDISSIPSTLDISDIQSISAIPIPLDSIAAPADFPIATPFDFASNLAIVDEDDPERVLDILASANVESGNSDMFNFFPVSKTPLL